MESLAPMLERAVENLPMMMLGDFTYDCLRHSSQAVKLMSLMSEYNFVQMVEGTTRVTQGSDSQEQSSGSYREKYLV